MSSNAPPTCSDCAKGGVVYLFEGNPYCPSCLAKKRPPLSHQGVERRKSQKSGLWRRRETDSTKKPGGE
jgi:hypothetical protein